ncbi:histidine phosphatase family protein [Microlunatus panaciterrae]|uniref:phosphoglycerate mutase (2,3-diphosphoglycerate-dependent) n=1 Tax=Microlunatus panaciterrae TaxID=400768 RepID=A0ABS2RPT8_9ACTN|nr:histidine phosphatase family protein [Microlunatus panaciterrae]MBM7800703.1 broad specificity phosphatase PhoE [Microlunatus panaciterrae]
MGVEELLLVRHGESMGNVAASAAEAAGAEVIEIGQRDADVPLSDTGIEQARALGAGLRELPDHELPTTVWSSPYARAVQTGQIALQAAGLALPFSVDERLRDRELGVLDLLTSRGVQARFPFEAQRRRWLGKFYHRPPGGESWADLVLRVRSFLADLERLEEGQRVLVVCHDAMVLAFRYVCERLTEAQILEIGATTPVINVSMSRLVRPPGDRVWQLVTFNDVSHLHRHDVPVTRHEGDRDVQPR